MIEHTHKGYKIEFDMESELWSCSDLEIAGNPKLSSIKKRIDEMSQTDRRVNVPALMVTEAWNDDRIIIAPVTVTMVCEPESYRGAGGVVKSCWITGKNGRSKVNLDSIFPLDCRADINGYIALRDAAKKAETLANEAFEAIPRHDADSLALAAKETADASARKRAAR